MDSAWLEPFFDDDGALHVLAAAGDVAGAEALMAERPTQSVNDLDEHGETPLYVACWHGRLAFAAWLLDRGADPNAKQMDTENTALHGVCFRSAVHGCDLLPLLLLKGASLESRSSNGYRPLHAAAFVGSNECCKLLLLAGADPTKRSAAKLAAKDICPARELADYLAKAEREFLAERKMSRRKSSRRHSVDVVPALGAPPLLAVSEALLTPSISDRVTRTREARERSVSTPFLFERSESNGVRERGPP